MATLLTRHDEGVGEGEYDSVKWAFQTHVHKKDNKRYKSAMLYGNEDAPERIEFFTKASPLYTDKPAYTWRERNQNPSRARANPSITIPGAAVIINPAQGTVSILAPKGTANQLLKGKRGIKVTRQKVNATKNPFQRGLDRGWYNAGRKAGRSSKYSSMEDAWHDKSEGWNFTPGKRVTAQESFYQGYQDTSK